MLLNTNNFLVSLLLVLIIVSSPDCSHGVRDVPVASITQNKMLFVDAKDYNEGGPNQAHTPPGKGSKG